MRPKPLIIVGGMGPQASSRLHELIIQKSTAYHDGDGADYPYIIHYSLPIRDFISDEKEKENAVRVLHRLAPHIQQLQPSGILLACNTAHILAPHVPYLQSPLFMSLIDVVVSHAQDMGVTTVGLLASPTTLRTKLYETPLANAGINCLRPDTYATARLEEVIRGVIAMQPMQNHDTFRAISTSLIGKGADAILLGCTELPLAFAGQDAPVSVIDCLDVYADAAIKQYYLYNKK